MPRQASPAASCRSCRTLAGMSGKLRLLIEPDADGTAELFAEVENAPFAGASSAWFSLQEIREFGERLGATFPIPSGTSIDIRGGYWSSTHRGVLEEEHLGLSFYPIGGAGLVGVRVILRTPLASGERPQSQSLAEVELKTHYEQLRSFGSAVVSLAAGSTRSAALECDAG